ncbi:MULTISPECIES: SAVED domain-containing protein [unclassified Sphingomonas]|uniref:SAVED domain-containing protein n=1 Tax=unclassified Sphingomonas TaxID=196159 RepID=UPI00226AE9E2|nr:MULTISPECIES: SAVED domain-containing protein [unclassified Sphingomonas]
MVEDADVGTRRAIGTFGVLSAGAGLGVVTPAIKEAILSFLNKRLGLQLFDAPPWMGWALIALGLICLLLAFFGQGRIDGVFKYLFHGRNSTVGTFLVVKHTGFVPPVRDIQQSELPKALNRCALQHLSIEVGGDLALNPPALEAALAKQLRMPDQITAILGVNPAAALGYSGIVQAPFQLLAGHQLASWTQVRTFEWDRHLNTWKALAGGQGPDLGVVTSNAVVGTGLDVGVAIEISYAIADAEIVASIPNIGRIVRVGVALPALDAVTHDGQVTQIAQAFRAALDGTRGIAPGARIHVFCSAPMSIGFALGRMVSRTLHPPVRVYAYNLAAPKPYPWGIEINAAPAAAIVRT